MGRSTGRLVAKVAFALGCVALVRCSSFSPASVEGAPDGGAAPSEAGLDAAPEAAADVADSAPPSPPSCVGLAATCGGNQDCCASNLVPGGYFDRFNNPSLPATVSAFRLDVYEVTVGRFRSFVNANKGTQASPPAPGDGAHPKITASGWDVAFNDKLEADSAALRAALLCNTGYPAWSDQPGGTDTRPMNCVNWFEAFAFCAWDGGRLPTKMELTYAAAGGSEGREYPWGAGIDATRASYDCAADGSDAGACAFTDILPAGSRSPMGDGKWGQADLAGNVWEWGLDWLATSPPNCVDCAVLEPDATNRVIHGGSFYNLALLLRVSVQEGAPPNLRNSYFGLRCARAVP